MVSKSCECVQNALPLNSGKAFQVVARGPQQHESPECHVALMQIANDFLQWLSRIVALQVVPPRGVALFNLILGKRDIIQRRILKRLQQPVFPLAAEVFQESNRRLRLTFRQLFNQPMQFLFDIHRILCFNSISGRNCRQLLDHTLL